MSLKRLLKVGCIVLGAALGVAYILAWTTHGGGDPYDVHAYWAVDPFAPYAHQGVGVGDAFQYPPPAAWIGALLHLLPFAAAALVWRLAQLGVIMAAAGPFAVLTLFAYPVVSELNLGNVNLFIGFAVAAGFRWPAAWALVLLTKPTAAVGLLYFVVRRDWRSLRVAIGVAVAVSAVSFALTPGAWIDYARYMLSNPAPSVQGWPGLWMRLPVAVVVAVVGGVRGWRWAAVVAAWLALPVWWDVSPSVLVGCLVFTWNSPVGTVRPLTPGRAGGSPSVALAPPLPPG